MKNFLMNCINAGNFVLHLILGTGIIMLFLKWERHFVLQLVISALVPFATVWFGEKLQQILFKAKPNAYDAVNSGIAGLITGIVFLSIYGFKFDDDIDPKQLPKEGWFYAGWTLIALSTLIWTAKQLIKKFKK